MHGKVKRDIHGFIQRIECNPQLRIFLSTEIGARLYDSLRGIDILYLDATGSLTKNTPKEYKRIYLYVLSIRHPTKGAVPYPVALYVTSDHHTSNIIEFFLSNLKILYLEL